MNDNKNSPKEYFKAQSETKRFRKKQRVWIVGNYANHLQIRFRWKGNGRYVEGVISKSSKCVGEIKKISD